MGESQGERELHLGEREKAESWREKSHLHGEGRRVPGRRKRESKEKFPKRSRRKHERVVDAKALQDDLQKLGFTPSLAKPEMGNEVGRQRAHS